MKTLFSKTNTRLIQTHRDSIDFARHLGPASPHPGPVPNLLKERVNNFPARSTSTEPRFQDCRSRSPSSWGEGRGEGKWNAGIPSRAVLARCIVLFSLIFTSHLALAQLPANFPTSIVITNFPSAVADGYVFEGVSSGPTNVGYYAMILTNDGSPIWYKELTNACYDFKVLPNGYLHYAQQIKALSYSGGGDVLHQILDESFNPVEGIQAGNGYIAEAHDFQLLPNGDALVLGYYLTQVDMSQVVPNGNPAALVSGAIIQELDAQRNVVWQWRAWDHYPFTSDWVNSTNAVISAFHVNCVSFDADGNLLISTPQWVKKINRQTGDILWHLGGTIENVFSFVGVTPQEGTNDFRGHGVHRLPNGNILLYNNSATGIPSSQAHEYSLDETNLIATHVWTYTPNPAVSASSQGYADRLTNGNTFVGWGGISGSNRLNATEVAGTNVVFQLRFSNTNVVSYRGYRFPFPSASQALTDSQTELATGNSYDFGATGVSISVQNGGGGYNRVDLTREPYAPVYPLFQGKAPRVVPVRVRLDEISIDSFDALIEFDAVSFGLSNPTNLTVNYRGQSGQGLFVPQTTSYNPVTHKLTVSISLTAQGGDLGEFIFCYPDVADVPYPPILNEVENYRGLQPYNVIGPKMATSGVTYSVNQQLPIALSWSPKGFARYYQLQIATNADFSLPTVSVSYQTAAYYVWSGAGSNTTYYYRVKTSNDGGESDWSSGAFSTAMPFVTVTVPNGGELWHRGMKYFIQWKDNLAENVTVDLYKGGVFLKNITNSVTSNGAYQWQVDLSLSAGNDYSIRISSATNSAITDSSDLPFNIDAPVIDSTSLTRLPDGRFSFSLSSPGATSATILTSSNLVSWQPFQTVNVNNGSAQFIDNTSTNLPTRFYRIRLP